MRKLVYLFIGSGIFLSILVVSAFTLLGVDDKTPEGFRAYYMALVKLQKNTPENLRPLYERSLEYVATSTLLAIMEENSFCHGDAHEVGRVIFRRTSKNLASAFDICKKQCQDGCYHGTLMEAARPENKPFGESGHVTADDFKNTMEKICALGENMQSRDECSHAMGHGLYISTLDMKKSVDLCEVFESPGLKYYCLTGVFMERDTYFGKEDIRGEDFRFPCSEYSDKYGVPCWRYKVARLLSLRLNGISQDDATKNVARTCLGFSGNTRLGCFHGLGVAKAGEIFENPASLGTICGYAEMDDERLACIDGAMENVSGVDTHKSRLACASLQQEDAMQFCNSIDGKKDSLSRKTTALYYR